MQLSREMLATKKYWILLWLNLVVVTACSIHFTFNTWRKFICNMSGWKHITYGTSFHNNIFWMNDFCFGSVVAYHNCSMHCPRPILSLRHFPSSLESTTKFSTERSYPPCLIAIKPIMLLSYLPTSRFWAKRKWKLSGILLSLRNLAILPNWRIF